jgi:hypothetical protein
MTHVCSKGLMPDRSFCSDHKEMGAMPFEETSVWADRISVLKDYDTCVFTVAERGRRYGVSRETIYVSRGSDRRP